MVSAATRPATDAAKCRPKFVGRGEICRKRTHKTLDLQGQKSILAMAPPGRPFSLITRKEIARNAKSRKQERVNELRRKAGANPSNPGVELGTTGLVFRRGV